MKRKITFILLALTLLISPVKAQFLQPDVDLVSEIVQRKQEEVKKRFLQNLVVKNIKTTNYTTYNTMYNLMNILIEEKNKTIMMKEVLIEVANYSINYSLVNYFLNEYFEPIDGYYYDKTENTLETLLYKGIDTKLDNKSILVRSVNSRDRDILFRNYVIDQMFVKLSKANISFLKDKGVLLEEGLKNRFEYGLNLDFSELDEELIAAIDQQMDSFIADFTILNNVSYEVIELLKSDNFNLNKLKNISKENVEIIFDLFSISLSNFERQIGDNRFLSKIGSLISKYVIYRPYNVDGYLVYDYFMIDIESIILSFEYEFMDKGITSLKDFPFGIKPFFIIGLNYGLLFGDHVTIPNKDETKAISQISYVSEKVGIKIMLSDFGYTHAQKPNEPFKYRGSYRSWKSPVNAPLINDVYLLLYGSGIIYNVVDLKSEDNFDFGLIGAGIGVTFFNDLELNVSYSVPIMDKKLSSINSFMNIGFDIPIFEYLRESKKK